MVKKIKDLTATDSVSAEDYLLVEQAAGTKKTQISRLIDRILSVLTVDVDSISGLGTAARRNVGSLPGQVQEALVSGQNIKTINNQSLLGDGDLPVVTDISGKQDVLESGVNIRTINGESVLGSGDLSISGGGGGIDPDELKTINSISLIGTGNITVQAPLVSGSNIKSINNNPITGSGNISLQTPLVSGSNIKTINEQSVLGSGNISIVSPVTSVASKTGVVTLTKGDVGLGNVDNTSDADKPVSSATQTALNNKVSTSILGAASGVATLDENSKLTSTQLPDLAISDYLGTAATEQAMLALIGQKGDWCNRSDLGTVWIVTGNTPSEIASWTQLSYPTAPVTSVAGKTGSVTLAKGDVGLGNVDNTADADKPVSSAAQTAINAAIATKKIFWLDASTTAEEFLAAPEGSVWLATASPSNPALLTYGTVHTKRFVWNITNAATIAFNSTQASTSPIVSIRPGEIAEFTYPGTSSLGGFIKNILPDATGSRAGAMPSAMYTKLSGIAVGAEVNVNADWNAASGDAQILNKPALGSFASKNVTYDTSAPQNPAVGDRWVDTDTMVEYAWYSDAWVAINADQASSGIPEAPSDGKQYARKDGGWAENAAPQTLATQAEAEAGTDNSKWMTPLRTAQAIAALETPDVSAVTVYYGLESETPASPIRGVEVGPFAGIPARVIAQIPENQGIARIVSNARAIAAVPSFAGYGQPYYENSIDLVFPDLETMCASAFQGLQLNAYSYQGFNFTSPKLRAVPASAFRESAVWGATGFPAATSIGAGAFNNCGNLTTVSLPAATSIGADAFNGCGNLSTLSLPAATSIGANAFNGCYNLTTVSLPAATSIGANAFNGCYNLTTVSLPAATSIGADAFNGCGNLSTLSLPLATSIGGSAFGDCIGLTSVSLPLATSIGSNAFYYCGNLTSVSLSLATSIGGYTFDSCYNLTSVSLPAATSIGDNAFYDCYLVSDIYLNAPFAGMSGGALANMGSYGSVTIHLRPSPNTPAGWTLGSGQALFGHANVNVAADWTTYPDLPV